MPRPSVLYCMHLIRVSQVSLPCYGRTACCLLPCMSLKHRQRLLSNAHQQLQRQQHFSRWKALAHTSKVQMCFELDLSIYLHNLAPDRCCHGITPTPTLDGISCVLQHVDNCKAGKSQMHTLIIHLSGGPVEYVLCAMHDKPCMPVHIMYSVRIMFVKHRTHMLN